MQEIQKSHFQKELISASKVATWVKIETVNPAMRAANVPKLEEIIEKSVEGQQLTH
jgi:hypothetical protein